MIENGCSLICCTKIQDGRRLHGNLPMNYFFHISFHIFFLLTDLGKSVYIEYNRTMHFITTSGQHIFMKWLPQGTQKEKLAHMQRMRECTRNIANIMLTASLSSVHKGGSRPETMYAWQVPWNSNTPAGVFQVERYLSGLGSSRNQSVMASCLTIRSQRIWGDIIEVIMSFLWLCDFGHSRVSIYRYYGHVALL